MGRTVPAQVLGKNWERVLSEVSAGSVVVLVDPDGLVVARIVTPDSLLAQVELLRKLRRASRSATAVEETAGEATVITLPARSSDRAHAHAHAG